MQSPSVIFHQTERRDGTWSGGRVEILAAGRKHMALYGIHRTLCGRVSHVELFATGNHRFIPKALVVWLGEQLMILDEVNLSVC